MGAEGVNAVGRHTSITPSTPNVDLEKDRNIAGIVTPGLTPSPCDGDNDSCNRTEPPAKRLRKLEPLELTGGARKGYLEWDDYFMAVAFLSAQRSKDPNTQVGACIVNNEKRIVGIGYNGFPTGCGDDKLPWSRDAAHELDQKYLYVCHAEMNAILNKNSADVKGCTIFVKLFPCSDCAKLIIQSGIAHVVYMEDKYHDMPQFIASRRMLQLAGVQCRRHVPKCKTVTINFDELSEQEVRRKTDDLRAAGGDSIA